MQITVERISETEMLVRGPESVQKWREANSYAVPGAEWSPQYQAGHWDGIWMPGRWCRMLNDETWEMRCSVGLLSRIRRDLPVQIDDNLAIGAVPKLVAEYVKTVPFESIHDHLKPALVDALMYGWGRVAMATNAGKGAVIALMCGYAKSHRLSVLVLCDELAVYDALVGEIRKWAGIRPRRIQAGTSKVPDGPGVTLAMAPTLVRRLTEVNASGALTLQSKEWRAWMAQQNMLLMDEADKAQADTWRKIIRTATGTWWRVGFSGTFPSDPYNDIRLDDMMGPVIASVRNKELIEKGISARPLIELHGFDATAALRGIRFTFRVRGAARRQSVFERAIVRNEARHAAIAALIRPDVLTVVIVNRVEHGKLLARAIGRATFLDGSADADERERAIEAWKRGPGNVLVTTKILDRGTNKLGAAADIIFASGEGSTTQTLQRLGRGLRRAGGKEYLRLVDVIDRVEPGDDQALAEAAEYIHVGGRKRTQLYADEGFESEVLP